MALREAQRAIKSRRHTSHPFYWAGFVVVGDGSLGVRLERNASGRVSPVWLVVAGAGVLAAGVVFTLCRKKSKESEPVA
jgi:hypothetical protein